MQINIAQKSDVDEIVELDALIIGNTRRRTLIAELVGLQQGYIARQESQIIGFLLMQHYFFGQPFIEVLIVDPSFRRQGVGTALMQHIETVYTPGKLFTSTNTSNKRMQQLCEQLGYVHSGIVENLDEGDPELIYFKKLTSTMYSVDQEAP